MARIEKGLDVVTLVNVFTVKRADQQKLIDLLVAATAETMKGQAGFVSASIHRSLDGTKVVNYAQWRRLQDFEAMRQNPKARAHMEAAAALGSFDPILCEVADSIDSDE